MKIDRQSAETDTSNIPRHVAFIMDGNGRWAKRRGLPRAEGHRQGVEALTQIVRMADEVGIAVMSVYAFSTENWSRPRDEVNALMGLLIEFFRRKIEELHHNRVRVRIMGAREGVPEPVLKAMDGAVARTQNNTGLILNIAFNYGGRADIVQAARALARRVQAGQMTVEQIDEQAFAGALYAGDLPDPELVIRTSGELRFSNFMLYQAAYSEFVVCEDYWPDFGREQFRSALDEYAQRSRRFGRV